jgi:hypothetical protein
MAALIQRWLAVALVLMTGPMASAACPMTWMQAGDNGCGANHASTERSAVSNDHGCCPRHPAKPAESQCRPAELNSGPLVIACCSVDPQPAATMRTDFPTTQMAIVARLAPESVAAPEPRLSAPPTDTSSTQGDVLDRKEDLRI